MSKKDLIEQNITRIQEYVNEQIEGAKWNSSAISTIETTLIIVGNSDDDYDFAVLFVPDRECFYCEIIENKIEYIDCEVDREICQFEGRIIFQYVNGNFEKLRGVVFNDTFHQFENCNDDSVCDTCSLQCECSRNYPVCFCDMFENIDQGEHMVNKGPIQEYIDNQKKPVNQVIINGVVYNVIEDCEDDCPDCCAVKELCDKSSATPCLLFEMKCHFEKETE